MRKIEIVTKPLGNYGQYVIAFYDQPATTFLGGTRWKKYDSLEEAKEDARQLAEAMHYKCKWAMIPAEGAKGVIYADPTKDRKEILTQVCKYVNEFEGRFYTGQDVGLTPEEITFMAEQSPYVVNSNTGHWTAVGLCWAYLAVQYYFKVKSVAIQGLGKCGGSFAKLLLEHFSIERLFVCDTDHSAVERFLNSLKEEQRQKVTVVLPPEDIYTAGADLFSPCALGGIVNKETLEKLKEGTVIMGSANNQIKEEEKDEIKKIINKRKIYYLTDFIVNAGGLIAIWHEGIKKDLDLAIHFLPIYLNTAKLIRKMREDLTVGVDIREP